MAMFKLSDMLGDVLGKNKEAFEKASRGENGPSGAYDTLLPTNLEYRVDIVNSEFKKSQAGREQIVLTYEVIEPEEFAGCRLQDYIDPKPATENASRGLASKLGALQAQVTGWGEDFDGFVKQFLGKTVIVSVRHWGDPEPRNGVRFTNQDKGQALRTNVQPQKASTSTTTAQLRPEINIPKDKPETIEEAPVATQTVLPTGAGSGANLPPGLRG